MDPSMYLTYFPQVRENLREVGFQVDLFHHPIYLMGNYLKYSRMLSQTMWYLEGKKHSSIQEVVAGTVMPLFQAKTNKFHAGGREDLDVRMLGEGRPFALEIENPKKTTFSIEQVHEMQKNINKSNLVNVLNLKITDKSCFEILKESEMNKIKQYSAVVYTTNTITEESLDKLHEYQDLVLQQQTPLRVLHRRTLMVREKTIHKMKTQYINSNFFVLHILASAGTYIKEFVHGDLNRTFPNVGQILGTHADIIQLDVIRLFEFMNDDVLTAFQQTPKFQL